MANSAGMSYNFKSEILTAVHNLNSPTTIKMALYTSAGSIGPGTQTYTAASELSSANYSAGGVTISNGAVSAISSVSAIWTPAAAASWTSIVYTNLDCALLYNSSAGNKCIAAFTFNPQTSAGGNFTLTMPSNAIGTALIQIT